jgi:hypothetical protein
VRQAQAVELQDGVENLQELIPQEPEEPEELEEDPEEIWACPVWKTTRLSTLGGEQGSS